MPLTRISLRSGKPEAYRQAIFDSLYRAMRETFDVPEDDQFIELSDPVIVMASGRHSGRGGVHLADCGADGLVGSSP